jgi:hypothetical protein
MTSLCTFCRSGKRALARLPACSKEFTFVGHSFPRHSWSAFDEDKHTDSNATRKNGMVATTKTAKIKRLIAQHLR